MFPKSLETTTLVLTNSNFEKSNMENLKRFSTLDYQMMTIGAMPKTV